MAFFVTTYCDDVFLLDLRSGSVRLEPGEYEYLTDAKLESSSGFKKSHKNILFCNLYKVEGIAYDDMQSFQSCILYEQLLNKKIKLCLTKLHLDENSKKITVCNDFHIFDAYLSMSPKYLYDSYLQLNFILSTDYEDIKLEVDKDIIIESKSITLGKYKIYIDKNDLLNIIDYLQYPNIFETTGSIYVTRFKFIEDKVVIIYRQRHLNSFQAFRMKELYYENGNESVYYCRKRSRIENVQIDTYEATLALSKRQDNEIGSIWASVQLLEEVYHQCHSRT
ncbi:MAG: hypothetical protein CMB64_05210 [Euryarchaeota archaeon]|nr:hypothetical protein [Euryarchaeota archaeon]